MTKLNDPLSIMVITKDSMYLHQAMVHPERNEFLKHIVKQVITYQKFKHWQKVPIKNISVEIKVSMVLCRKCKIGTSEVSEYKAKLYSKNMV